METAKTATPEDAPEPLRVIVSPTTATPDQLRTAAANGDQTAYAELCRRGTEGLAA